MRIAAAAAVIAPLLALAAPGALAKTPGAAHCFGQYCHRVASLDEMDGIVGHQGMLKASFYDDCKVDRFNICNLTSSGEVFRPDAPDHAASPILPDGTVIVAYHPRTHKAAVLRINSAGPYRGDRTLDVSRASAEKLGFRSAGVAELMVAVVKPPLPEDARYKERRRYPRVPGYMGAFANFDAAHEAALTKLSALDGMRVSALETGEITPVPVPESDDAAASKPRVAPLSSVPASEGAVLVAVEPPTIRSLPAPQLSLADTFFNAGNAIVTMAGTATAVASHEIRESRITDLVGVREGEHETAGLWQRFANLIEGAKMRARAPQRWRAGIRRTGGWQTRFAVFLTQARLRARAGVKHGDPLYRLLAELKIKAQPPRW